MQGLNTRTSSARCFQAARFVDHRVTADPSVSAIAAEIIEHNARLRTSGTNLEDAVMQRLLARAQSQRTSVELKKSMRLVGSGIVARRNGSRASSTFSLLFPKGYAGFTRLQGARLLAEATRLDRLIRASSDETVQKVVAKNGDELTAAIEAAQAALEALEAATQAEAEAKQGFLQVKAEWLGAYYRAQRAFEGHFSDDPSLAESYFVRFGKSRRSAEGDVETPIVVEATPEPGHSAEPASGPAVDPADESADDLPLAANM
ncbi:MAG: hypothetical protein R3E97_11890 [Candidatus Eisenbacteria bacterium]